MEFFPKAGKALRLRRKPGWTLYAAIAKELNRKKVDYVFIGATGINLYARRPDQIISTQDLDIFVRPRAEHFLKAVEILHQRGFELEAGGEPAAASDRTQLVKIFSRRANVRGTRKDAVVELLLEMKGFRFDEVFAKHRQFRLGRIPIRVGDLGQLLGSKKLVGRAKDRLFLATYEEKIREALEEERRREKKKKKGD